MSGGASKREIEIKLRLRDAAQGRRLLRQAGFRVIRRRNFEANVVFDTPHADLRKRGALLRLRRSGHHSIMTYKGPPVRGKHKTRPEVEVEISDPINFQQVLRQLGYEPVFRYEKYRAEHRGKDGRGLITLDETPIGVFFELEGPAGWIDRTARRLGFSESEYITDTYGKLYRDHCRREGIPPQDMVFACGSQDTTRLVCSSKKIT